MPGNNSSSDQAKRFEEAAREAGCDETGRAFERAFGKIVPPKVPEKRGSVATPTDAKKNERP